MTRQRFKSIGRLLCGRKRVAFPVFRSMQTLGKLLLTLRVLRILLLTFQVLRKLLFTFQADSMMSCPLPIVPVIQPLPTTLSSQTDFPIHIGIKVSASVEALDLIFWTSLYCVLYLYFLHYALYLYYELCMYYLCYVVYLYYAFRICIYDAFTLKDSKSIWFKLVS